ncbi:16S rRNA (uracil(1498)-N(3))-methyltransferase [Defluviitalea phaphyphila]|uniref:16S rRNA (uracil(1498)-N(3))-methyltransferase n=1 Tax=Defluviitalea phaphyphila TaxID=1473580 RepID=UPI0007316671|nr:16S rRNA (uracil(1498)-N(3))-methyltransferase [Defluviitalea phaphyphila]
MHRFFVEPTQIKNNNISIYGEDVKHISKVLRLKNNDKIIICNGQGTDYECIIKNINKEEIVTEIISSRSSSGEPKVKITLFQGVTKSDKMNIVIQKCVEMGIYKIVPVITDRTIVKIENEKKEKSKLLRWQKISEAAAKQSQRGIIPNITEIITFSEAIKEAKKIDFKVIAYEKEKINHLKDIFKKFEGRDIAIFIGPEGGFTEEEISLAKENNIIPITLGKRILRTETAGLFLLSIMMYEIGEV